MNLKLSVCLALGTIGLTSTAASTPAPAPPGAPVQVPMENFARLSVVRHVNISPDGQVISYTLVKDKETMIAFRNLVTEKMTGVEGALGFYASYPHWVANDRVVYGYMSGINRDGTKYAGLLGYPRRDFKRDQDNLIVGGILFSRFTGKQAGDVLLLEFDRTPITASYGFAYVYHPNVVRMDTKTGNYRSILTNPGKVVGWGTDKDGVVKVGVEFDKGYSTVIYRENADAPWHKLDGLVNIKRTMGLEGLSADGNTLYVTTPTPTGTWGVHAYDLKAKKLGEMLVGHDSYDILRNEISVDGHPIERMVFAPATHELLGIQYFTDVPKVLWFDPTLASVQDALDQGLPNRVNSIVDMSDDLKKLVVLSWSAQDPGTYYFFDLDKKQLKQLFATEPWIKPEQMADVFPVSYKSRDGLVIHGYLTVPKGKEPKNLPLVVFPHGGPFGRDSWGYKKDPQFLASRGYAVLQMNYRGSPGYGEDFFVKGQRHIGRELQDDITDGTRWAIAQGIADPKRIAIMGWSFGGYSALMGAIREPELYRCAIDLAGVTDWVALLKYQRTVTSGIGDENNAEMIGDPDRDAADLADISPVNHVSKIRVPLLLVYSKDDVTVPYEQARLLRDALDKAKTPYELVTKVNEGHGFYTYDHRLELYQKIDQFLAANMK